MKQNNSQGNILEPKEQDNSQGNILEPKDNIQGQMPLTQQQQAQKTLDEFPDMEKKV